MATKGKFPKTLNVTVENEGEGDDEYLDLNGTMEEKAVANEERLVAVYELKELVSVKANVTTEIVSEPYKRAEKITLGTTRPAERRDVHASAVRFRATFRQ